jgi:hypothetical protein
MVSRHLLLAVSLSLLTAVTTGCAPTMRVRVLKPAPVNLGTVKQLALVQSEGRPRARDTILGELKRQTRQDGYFQIKDRLDAGMAIKVTGDSARFLDEGGTASLQPDEVGLRLDVAEWDADMESTTVDVKDKDGKVTGTERVDYYQAEVVLVATVFHPSGKALISEREYRASAQDSNDKNNALWSASVNAVSKLLRDITPSYVTQEIRMDDDDDGQKPIIQLAEQGNVPAALSNMQGYVQSHPDNASALYNLAVLLDASGRYSEALEYYDRAIALSNKDYYMRMKQECTLRKSNQEALAQDIP